MQFDFSKKNLISNLNQKENPKAIFLMGPTAAGKTELALSLAKYLPIEIISVDSALVYRGMDIGTGKPSLEERGQVPHHLIDIRDPREAYSAAEFAKGALILMDEITQRGHIPVLVGGTLLYFRALQKGLSPLPSANPEIRAKLLEEANNIGWAAMHAHLAAIDPITAARLHPNDPQRIQRALEVYEISGKPMSSFFSSEEIQPDDLLKEDLKAQKMPTQKVRPISEYEIFVFAISPTDRKVLHQRIADRFHQMLANGFVEEVETLSANKELSRDLPSMRAVGYRQVLGYLAGDYDYNTMVEKGIAATRQLAKRQLTWLRSLPDVIWLQGSLEDSLSVILKVLEP